MHIITADYEKFMESNVGDAEFKLKRPSCSDVLKSRGIKCRSIYNPDDIPEFYQNSPYKVWIAFSNSVIGGSLPRRSQVTFHCATDEVAMLIHMMVP